MKRQHKLHRPLIEEATSITYIINSLVCLKRDQTIISQKLYSQKQTPRLFFTFPHFPYESIVLHFPAQTLLFLLRLYMLSVFKLLPVGLWNII